MTWLEGDGLDARPAGERLGELLERPQILRVPGAHNALAGLIAKQTGFEALYMSGGGLTASLGLPDLGVMTLDDLCYAVRNLYRATDLPIIVDADTGYGEALNVMRCVRELEAAGAAAMQMEDQTLPKKCGHLNDKQLIPAEDMALKVAAAVRARSHLRIIARTDAMQSEGMDGAIARARLYIEAGADVAFPDGLASEEEFRAFAEGVGAPVMANMTEFGRTPHFTAEQFQDMGYGIVIWPVSQLRVAARAMQELYAHIFEEGGTAGMENRMMTRAETYELIGYHDFEALDAGLVKSTVPKVGG